jgi:hypothetical protein
LHIPDLLVVHAFKQEGMAMRSLTDLVSEGFIWSVGITRPRPGQEHRAAVYITTVLIISLLIAAGLFFFLCSKIL